MGNKRPYPRTWVGTEKKLSLRLRLTNGLAVVLQTLKLVGHRCVPSVSLSAECEPQVRSITIYKITWPVQLSMRKISCYNDKINERKQNFLESKVFWKVQHLWIMKLHQT